MSESKIKRILRAIIYFIAFVTCTSVAHMLTVNLYVSMCAPLTWMGPFYTMVSMGSPVCHFLNTVQTQLTQHYITLWSGAAVGLVTWLATTTKSE